MDNRKVTPSSSEFRTDQTTSAEENRARVVAEAYAVKNGLTVEKISKVTSKPVRGSLVEVKGATVFYRAANGSRVEQFIEI
jgi:hypothetical protein